MGRIPEDERLSLVDGFIGHWAEADGLGTPIEIAPLFGQPQLVALRDDYHAKFEEIFDLQGELDQLRAERDAIFGTTSDDELGVWFRLKQYKPMVRLKLGARHPLSKTIPNLGNVRPSTHLSILHRFLNHWGRVNTALGTPLTLGAFSLADLQTAHDTIDAKRKAIEAIDDGSLPLARAEREKMFGDLPEDERDDESIIARLQLYSITIATQFPGQPIADTLPPVFPGSGGSSPTLPTFRFNWAETAPGELRTWHEVLPLEGAATVFLREGAFEESQVFDPADPDGVQVIDWSGVTIVDELDELEIRDANGISLATGNRDLTFAEPVTV